MLAKFISRAGVAALVLAALSVAVSAQVITATGKVTLKQADGTEVPVVGAQIKFYRTDIKQRLQTKTDKKGEYTHAGIPLVGTFNISVSGPGARPDFIRDVKISGRQVNNFVLAPGDGSELTEQQILAATPRGSSAPATGGSAPKLSEDDKKRAAEAAAEARRIEEANAKATELNTKLPDILKAGNTAFAAGSAAYKSNNDEEGMRKFDEAISNYDQGIALDPTQGVFYRNKAIVLRARGVEKFNASIKAKDIPGRDAAKADFKLSVEAMEKALVAMRETAGKNAAPAGGPAQPTDELGYLFDRAESYRIGLQTGTSVDTTLATKALEEYIAAEIDPAKKMKGQAGLGDALFMGGKIDESIQVFRGIISSNPQNLDAMTGLATALAAKGGSIEGSEGTKMIAEARDLFQDFIKKAPDTHPKKASAIEIAQYLDETLKSAAAPKTTDKPTERKGTTRRRP